MKKRYFDPEAEIIELLVKDIITGSPDTVLGGDDGLEEEEFGDIGG